MSIYDETNMQNVTVHVLHVDAEFDPKHPGDSFETWHPVTCPTGTVDMGPMFSYTFHDCVEGQLIGEAGEDCYFRHRDDPNHDGREMLLPGRYAIQAWTSKSPSTPDHGEEWDAGLELIPEVTP